LIAADQVDGFPTEQGQAGGRDEPEYAVNGRHRVEIGRVFRDKSMERSIDLSLVGNDSHSTLLWGHIGRYQGLEQRDGRLGALESGHLASDSTKGSGLYKGLIAKERTTEKWVEAVAGPSEYGEEHKTLLVFMAGNRRRSGALDPGDAFLIGAFVGLFMKLSQSGRSSTCGG
jgi:hypothetical protein